MNWEEDRCVHGALPGECCFVQCVNFVITDELPPYDPENPLADIFDEDECLPPEIPNNGN